MANALDDINGPTIEDGRDVKVIAQTVPAKCGEGTKFFFNIASWFFFVIPGFVVKAKKAKWRSYFSQLEQNIQARASTVDNLMENRVMILKNAAKLLDKAINFDKDTFEKIAAYRSGATQEQIDVDRNNAASAIDQLSNKINIAFENYPDLKAHSEIADIIQQNEYYQKEITAARDLYNDAINTWNREIFEWPLRLMVAEEMGLTTRIPFSTTKAIKEQARGTFF